MLCREEFEQALASQNQVTELRAFALELHAQGKNKQEIYDLFLQFYQFLQASGREMEEHLLGDVMDMIMGEFAPFNLNFPGEDS
jgi:hypothetical protein